MAWGGVHNLKRVCNLLFKSTLVQLLDTNYKVRNNKTCEKASYIILTTIAGKGKDKDIVESQASAGQSQLGKGPFGEGSSI